MPRAHILAIPYRRNLNAQKATQRTTVEYEAIHCPARAMNDLKFELAYRNRVQLRHQCSRSRKQTFSVSDLDTHLTFGTLAGVGLTEYSKGLDDRNDVWSPFGIASSKDLMETHFRTARAHISSQRGWITKPSCAVWTPPLALTA